MLHTSGIVTVFLTGTLAHTEMRQYVWNLLRMWEKVGEEGGLKSGTAGTKLAQM